MHKINSAVSRFNIDISSSPPAAAATAGPMYSCTYSIVGADIDGALLYSPKTERF